MAAVDPACRAAPDGTHTCFFYGTLIHPHVLARIIGSPGAHLGVQLALLPAYVARRVDAAEYPGLAAWTPDGSETTARCVRGVVVRGLSAADVRALDAFEGDEYVRTPVSALVLGGAAVPNALRTPRELPHLFAHLTPERIALLLQQEREGVVSPMAQREVVDTYVWRAGSSGLLQQEWRWEHFVGAHAARWVSGERN